MSEEKHTPSAPTEPGVHGLLAEYVGPDELIAAAERVRKKGFERWDCYSPFPVHGIDPAMGIKRTKLPYIVMVAGLTGLTTAVGFQWWANAIDYPFLISGKPFWSLAANIPITFELTVLFSAITTFVSMMVLNGLPKPSSPLDRVKRFARATDDRFFLMIETADPKFDGDATRSLLDATSPVHVEEVMEDVSSEQIPKGLIYAVLIAAAFAVVPFGLIASARETKSTKPQLHIVFNMDAQAKYKPQRRNEFFAGSDGRATRLPVEGTVAVGELRDDEHLYAGKVNGQFALSLPEQIQVNAQTMARGEQRYGIYCTPCHGEIGDGDGMVHRRAAALKEGTWVKPTNVNSANIAKKPVGELFNTISNGIRNMPGYARQIEVEDRWAIVLYLRALQRSQGLASK